MKHLSALLLFLLLTPVAVAQDDGHDHDEPGLMEEIRTTPPLFLMADGSLVEQSGSSQECLAVDAQSGTQTASFATTLANATHHIESSTVSLTVAFTANSNPGSGFRLDAALQQGNAPASSASRTYGPGASVGSPITLAFDVDDVEPSLGATTLTLTLTPTAIGGVLPGVLDVGVQCGVESRLHAFEYAVFTETEGDPFDDGHGHDEEGEIKTLYVILIAIGAAIVTFLAGILPLIGKALAPQRLHLFLGITAGLLLSIAMVDLIPEAIEEGGGSVAWTVALGILILYGVKHLAGETHSHADHGEHPSHHAPDAEDDHTDPHAGRFAAVAFGALLFHRLVDGLALPGAFASGGDVGFAASSAILIHQFPDGLAAASVFLGAGWQRKKILLAVAGLAFATPLGSLAGLAFAGIDGALPHLLALAAATFIFIALAELLPELRAKQYRFIVVVGFLLGYGLTFGIELFAELFGGGHGH